MKKKLLRILVIAFAACIIIFTARADMRDTEKVYYMSDGCQGELQSLSLISDSVLSRYDNLMIVAHPDDETIWGGAHLLKDNYVIICITNGNNRTRRKEFAKVTAQTHSAGIMLTYPDKTDGKRDSWDTCKDQIQEDLSFIIGKKQWNQIVTHNPDGEYGHIHHQMTSNIVSDIAQNQNLIGQLYYFGKYVKKKDMDNDAYRMYLTESLPAKQLKNKNSLAKLYSSQKRVMEGLSHMFPYENWTKAAQ